MARKIVGLDLGSSGVRAVQFTTRRARLRIDKVASAPLPRGAIDAGVVRDPAAVSGVLKALWSAHKLAKNVVIGLANNDVVVRPVDLDWMEPEDFRKALPYQVADAISIPVENAYLDYHTLGIYDRPGDDGTAVRKQRILLVVTARDMVDGFVAAVQGAGLTPVKADLIPFALIRAARPLPAEPNSAEAIIDIGADVTVLVVHQGGQPRFVRIIANQGGQAITDALADQFHMGLDDAEKAKIGLGDPATDGMSGYGPTHPAQPIIADKVGRAVTEIASSLAYFFSQSGDVNHLSRVVLTGGGSLTPTLRDRLSAALRLTVEYGTPLAGLAAPAAPTSPVTEQQMAVAVGLCLGVAA